MKNETYEIIKNDDSINIENFLQIEEMFAKQFLFNQDDFILELYKKFNEFYE